MPTCVTRRARPVATGLRPLRANPFGANTPKANQGNRGLSACAKSAWTEQRLCRSEAPRQLAPKFIKRLDAAHQTAWSVIPKRGDRLSEKIVLKHVFLACKVRNVHDAAQIRDRTCP